jgi:hypothetical protein
MIVGAILCVVVIGMILKSMQGEGFMEEFTAVLPDISILPQPYRPHPIIPITPIIHIDPTRYPTAAPILPQSYRPHPIIPITPIIHTDPTIYPTGGIDPTIYPTAAPTSCQICPVCATTVSPDPIITLSPALPTRPPFTASPTRPPFTASPTRPPFNTKSPFTKQIELPQLQGVNKDKAYMYVKQKYPTLMPQLIRERI